MSAEKASLVQHASPILKVHIITKIPSPRLVHDSELVNPSNLIECKNPGPNRPFRAHMSAR